MPYDGGYVLGRSVLEPKPIKVGRPHRDRTKVKAGRKAARKTR